MIERYTLTLIIAADCIVRQEFAHEQFPATAAKTLVVACRPDHFRFLATHTGQTTLPDIAAV